MQDSPVNRLAANWPQLSTPYATGANDDASWSETAKSWEVNLENFMGDHPKLTLAAAAAVGLLLGWMVKRK
jgi:ElaB/YqjD/DUF883 family membrane-anchored ribosome-binding protein